MKYIVVAEAYPEVSTARYRAWDRRDQMENAGIETILWVGWNKGMWNGTKGRTALVQRIPYTPEDEGNFERLKRECVRVGFDIDDLLFEHHRLPRHTNLDPEKCRQYARAIHWADYVTCSTPELAREVAARWPDKAVHVFPNVIGRLLTGAVTRANLPPRRARRVTLGYTSATMAHQDDLGLIEPVLDAVLQDYPDVDLVLVGTLDLTTDFIGKWRSLGRVQCWPFVSYEALPFLIHGIIDINLVPLLDIPFNRCKSLVKWLEAAVVGVPTVCSRIGRYKELPEGTAYSAGDPTEWRYFLDRLIASAKNRQTMGARARKHAIDTYTYLNPHPVSWLKET